MGAIHLTCARNTQTRKFLMRGLSRGDVILPPWLLPSCCLIHWLALLTYPHSLFSLGRQGMLASRRLHHMPSLYAHCTQGHNQTQFREEPVWIQWGTSNTPTRVTGHLRRPWDCLLYTHGTLNWLIRALGLKNYNIPKVINDFLSQTKGF